MLHWTCIGLALATAACSAGAMRFYFVNWRETSRAQLALAASAVVCQAVQLTVLVLSPGAPVVCQALGAAAYVLANLLFWWSVRAHGDQPPAAAFTPGAPAALVLHGPYRYVRHPFYSSYMLAWLAGCLAAASPWLLLTALWMFAFYFVAARGEEAAILRSEHADEYRDYRKRTGMFLPKVARAGRSKAVALQVVTKLTS